MARRRRTSFNRNAVLGAGAGAGLLWVWTQTWGPTLLYAIGAIAIAGGIAHLATASRRRQRHLKHLATMHGLLALTPLEFEYEVADLLRSLGFTEVLVTGAAGDLQADIVATDPDGHHTIVQCKRYAPERTIGSPVIQSFIGMARIHHDCDRAMFVTTGTFTAPAQHLADEHDIELLDGDDLVEMFAARTEAFA